MKTKLKKKVISVGFVSVENEFVSTTKEYGNAEFLVCPILRRGKIREVYIYPLQQPEAKFYFYAENKQGWGGIHFGSLLNNDSGLQEPNVWRTFFCKEHKCHSFEFYVPRKSKSFRLDNGLGDLWFKWQ